MDGVEDIFDRRETISGDIDTLTRHLTELNRLLKLTIAFETDRRIGRGHFARHPYYFSALALSQIIDNLNKSSFSPDRPDLFRIYASTTYSLLRELFVDSQQRRLNHRPLIDCLLQSAALIFFIWSNKFPDKQKQFGSLSNSISESRAKLAKREANSIIFYCDFFPYKKLWGLEPSSSAQNTFRRLVADITFHLTKIGGRLEALTGTDTIRGKLPRSPDSLAFLTTGLRRLTQQFFARYEATESSQMSYGWSIGIATGEASIFFGQFEEGAGLEEAARNMERADEKMRLAHRGLKDIGEELTDFSGQTLVSQPSLVSLSEFVEIKILESSSIQISSPKQITEFPRSAVFEIERSSSGIKYSAKPRI